MYKHYQTHKILLFLFSEKLSINITYFSLAAVRFEVMLDTWYKISVISSSLK